MGSMHGTTRNGFPVEKNTPTEIRDGDNLIFGAEVRRGLEVFPACSFHIAYQLSNYRPTNSYSFPEASDEEGLFSDGHSEDDGASDDEVSVSSSEPKISQVIDTIDLTRDESPRSSSLEIVRQTLTTSRAEHEMESIKSLNDETTCNFKHHDVDATESEDIEMDHYSSDDESDLASQSSQENSQIDNANEFEEDSDVLESVYDNESDVDVEPAASSHSLLQSQREEIDRIAESIINQQVGEYGSFEVSPGTTYSERNPVIDRLSNSTEDLANSNYSVDPLEVSCHGVTLPPPSTIPDSLVSNEQQSVIAREPSPSDAAMAKVIVKQATNTPCVSTTGIQATHSLGNGTGKEAFFRAREENKAVMKAAEFLRDTEPATHSGTLPQVLKLQGHSAETCPTTSLNHFDDLDEGESLCDENMDGFENENEYRVDRPGSMSNDVRLPSVDYCFSPILQPATVEHIPQTPPTIQRPGLSIKDLIDLETPELYAKPAVKRKADKISSVMEEEVRAWASTLTSQPSDALAATPTAGDAATLCITSVNTSQISEHRPAKKLRRIMEKMGYAALGGVAVGAALFGSLVATAPDFL